MTARSRRTLPPLEIDVTANDGHVTRYKLGTSSRSLAPGEQHSAFRAGSKRLRKGVKIGFGRPSAQAIASGT